MCRRNLGPRFDFESVAQDIWIEAYMLWGETVDHLVPVPYSMIHRRCIDARRRATTLQVHSEAAAEAEEVSGEATTEILDQLGTLVSRAKLTPWQESVLVRHVVWKQDINSIASNRGVSVASVSKTLAEALDLLRSAARQVEGD